MRASPARSPRWSGWSRHWKNGDAAAIDAAIKTIVLLHGIILSFGGLPLLYYGDEIGTLNSLEYLADPSKAADNRWMHRSSFDWNKAKKRLTGSVEQRIFSALKKMIALRKEIAAFADFDNRQLLALDNPNLLAFSRSDPLNNRARVLVIGNFNVPAPLNQQNICRRRSFRAL
jgi:amylosucrase